MLTKNIYMLYPAGYSGNYVSWAISISDTDLKKQTVLDPLNNDNTAKFGGVGTSHYHTRRPTHQMIEQHIIWMALNRPDQPQTFVINVTNKNISTALMMILQSDRDPVIIVIHDEDEPDVRTYGNLNTIQKWPTYAFARAALTTNHTELTYDMFNCADSKDFRNDVASGLFPYSVELSPINDTNRTEAEFAWRGSQLWFKLRNSVQPHEVLSEQYIINDQFPWARVFQLSCRDVASVNFPKIIDNILDISGACSSVDTDHLHQFHYNYIQRQQNLQWFTSIANWRSTGKLDKFLLGHASVQGYVIKEILNRTGYITYNPDHNVAWCKFYNQVKDHTWPDVKQELDFQILPSFIQAELTEVHGFKFNLARINNNINLAMFNGWNEMSTVEINDIFNKYFV